MYQDHVHYSETTKPRGLLALINLDATLTLMLMCLCTTGLVILYSASNKNLDLVFAQSSRMAFGALLMLIVAFIPPRFLKSITPWFFLFSCGCLVLIFFTGVEAKGAHRWLDLKIFRFQPSELMKLAAPMMAAYFMDKRSLPPSFPAIVAVLLITIIPCILIFFQPDLGTALLVLFACLSVLFLSGIGWRYIIITLLIAAIALPTFWEFGMQPYQRDRVATLLNPESDPLGKGYQIIQSKIAIGSGGIYGKGWQNSTQASLKFLPESTTDFIYAITAEEFGLAGISALIFIYLIIIIRVFVISIKGQDAFCRLLGGSISMCFFFYIFINAGMVSGILPIVGIPLPFISYGGTSIVTLFLAFGIVMSIYAHPAPVKKRIV